MLLSKNTNMYKRLNAATREYNDAKQDASHFRSSQTNHTLQDMLVIPHGMAGGYHGY